jgi:hypothetical protein
MTETSTTATRAQLDITEIPTPAHDAALHLYSHSALGPAFYGPVGMQVANGRTYLVTERPRATFSDGERHLWACLVALVVGQHLSDDDVTGCPHLDATNVAALRTAAELASAVVA